MLCDLALTFLYTFSQYKSDEDDNYDDNYGDKHDNYDDNRGDKHDK